MARRKFTPEFKLKVAVEALAEQKSLSMLAKKHNLAPAQISNWKQELKKNGAQVFTKSTKSKSLDPKLREDELMRIIGELQVENMFLKKDHHEN
jgi:transposase-like protein